MVPRRLRAVNEPLVGRAAGARPNIPDAGLSTRRPPEAGGSAADYATQTGVLQQLPTCSQLGSRLLESACQVVPQVFDVFATHAKTQEAGRQVLLARQFGPTLYGAFDPTEAGGRPYDTD